MDFSSVGGVAVPTGKKLDFSSVGGRPAQDEATILSQFKKNLLATKSPDDWSGKMARSLPATIGAGIGAAAMVPTGPLGMAGGAYIGGVAGEGMRNAASGLSNLFTEQGPPTAEQGLNDMRRAGIDQMEGQMLGSAVTGEPMVEGVYKPAARAVANTVKDKTAAFYKMFAGIPEALTKHAMARGPKEILTAANAEPVMQQTALEGMRAAAIGQKQAAGELVGTAENNFLASPASRTLFDVAPIGGAVRQELTRPVFDPTVSAYGGAAAEKGALEGLAGTLESGPTTGRTLQGLKTNLNRGVDWNGSPIPNPSPDLQRVTKGVSEQLRGTLANADPQGLGIANPNFHDAAGVYSGYQKPLGDVPKPSVSNDKDTINRLRIAFGKGDAAEGITNFDKVIAESRAKSLAVREQLIPPSPAAAARVQAEQARAVEPPASRKPTFEVPWQKRPEGPGWLDQPPTTPGRDFQDAVTAAAFYGKSDPMRAPSSTLLRILGALGPATGARFSLKVGQTSVQAGRAAAPSSETVDLLLPRLLAELRRQQNEELR